jgi:hypothetical protein
MGLDTKTDGRLTVGRKICLRLANNYSVVMSPECSVCPGDSQQCDCIRAGNVSNESSSEEYRRSDGVWVEVRFTKNVEIFLYPAPSQQVSEAFYHGIRPLEREAGCSSLSMSSAKNAWSCTHRPPHA